MDNVPVAALLTFKLVIEAPEPEKVEAEILVIDNVVPVKPHVNVPPPSGKNKLNVDAKVVPFLDIS